MRKPSGVGARNVIDTNTASLAQTHLYRGPNQLAASLKSVLPWPIAVVPQGRTKVAWGSAPHWRPVAPTGPWQKTLAV